MNNTNFTTAQIRDNILSLVKENDVLFLNKSGIPFELEWWDDLAVDAKNKEMYSEFVDYLLVVSC